MDIMELSFTAGLSVIILAFIAEYIDSTLGMGYGTTLTQLMLLMGYAPLQVVPAILLSEFITGLLAGFTHHSLGNVDFRPKTMNPRRIYLAIRRFGILDSFHKGVPRNLKVALLIAICSIVGTILAVLIAVSIPKFYLTLYIGVLVAIIGVAIIATSKRRPTFLWRRIICLSLLASFNKGMSGGGYGPVVTGGQLIAGVDGKNAIGITSLAEGLTCIAGVITYLSICETVDWSLAPYLVIGAVVSVPFSALTVRRIKTDRLRLVIGIVTLCLGLLTLVKCIL